MPCMGDKIKIDMIPSALKSEIVAEISKRIQLNTTALPTGLERIETTMPSDREVECIVQSVLYRHYKNNA